MAVKAIISRAAVVVIGMETTQSELFLFKFLYIKLEYILADVLDLLAL